MLYKKFRAAVSGCSWQASCLCDSKRPFSEYSLNILEELLFLFHDRKLYGQKIRVPSLQGYSKDHFQK